MKLKPDRGFSILFSIGSRDKKNFNINKTKVGLDIIILWFQISFVKRDIGRFLSNLIDKLKISRKLANGALIKLREYHG